MSVEDGAKSRDDHRPSNHATPKEVVENSGLTHREKKALENLEQDAHQLLTASNEGMTLETERIVKGPDIAEVVNAKYQIGEKAKQKPSH